MHNGTVTYNGLVNLDETLNLGNGSTIIVGSGITTGQTVITAAGNVTDGAAVTIQMPTNLADGATVTVFDAAGGTTDGTYTTTNTGLFSYTTVISDAADTVVVTVAKNSSSVIASTLGVTTDVASALDNANTAILTGDATALAAMETAMNTGGATAKKAAETVGVQADTIGGGTASSMATGGKVLGVAATRLAMMRSGDMYAGANETGFATGDKGMAKAAWIKPFGNWINQDDSDGVSGYDATTYGVAFGLDAEVVDNVRLGGSLAFSSTDVNGDGAGASNLEAKSYQATIYGDYTAEKYFVEGSLGYARNENDMSRTITVAALTRTATGANSSNQYMASIGGGMPIQLDGPTYLTPMVRASYTMINSDSYTETGALGFNQNVNPDDVQSLVFNAGGKIHSKIKMDGGYLIPMVHAGLSYDVLGDEAVVTSSFTGGGASFQTTGAEVEQFGGNAGLGLTFDEGSWSVGANYDLDLKSGFVGHSGSLEARMKF